MSNLTLEQKVRSEIPALKNFSFSVGQLSDHSISIKANLKDHLNHKGTAFGGSIYQISLIASYGLLFHTMRSNDFHTQNFVIADAKIKYKRPIAQDFTAVATIDESAVKAFTQKLSTDGKAEISITSTITLDSKICSILESRFVILKNIPV